MDYCSAADLYDFGLPRGSFPNPGRHVETVTVPGSVFEVNAHGLEDGDALRLRPDIGGSMPVPLVVGTTYYAIVVDDSRFRVSATAEGAALSVGTSGCNVLLVLPFQVAKWITYASRVIDELIPAHAVPLGETLEDIPPIVRMTCAELAAWKGGLIKGARSATLTEAVDAAKRRLDKWEAGRPIRGAVSPPQVPTNLARTAPRRDPTGWGRHGGC